MASSGGSQGGSSGGGSDKGTGLTPYTQAGSFTPSMGSPGGGGGGGNSGGGGGSEGVNIPGPPSPIVIRSNNPVQPRQPATLRPMVLGGNRDWPIYVECRAQSIVIYPSRQEIPISSLTRDPKTNPLSLLVTQMIARRQALVRPGETPYRPKLNFLVHEDALRAYHQTYPTVETLNIPMVRHSLAKDDDIEKILSKN